MGGVVFHKEVPPPSRVDEGKEKSGCSCMGNIGGGTEEKEEEEDEEEEANDEREEERDEVVVLARTPLPVLRRCGSVVVEG